MQTNLADFIKDTPQGREADAILRKCVHCGFCTATCPTYQLLGDELDGPRGRIYLIKQVLEGHPVGAKTRLHLDRCLTCRACETTCPSGVRYGRLLDVGRSVVDEKVPRGALDRALRKALRAILADRRRFAVLLRITQALRPLMPGGLRRKVPAPQPQTPWPQARHRQRMICLTGCVQPAIAPEIDAAAARALDRIEISLIRPQGAGCCGALSYHLGAQREGLDRMRANIDAWWPSLHSGASAIVATSSACGAMIKEYGELLAHDPEYAERSARVSELARDVSEVLSHDHLAQTAGNRGESPRRIAFHSPCTLQHAQRLAGAVESRLTRAGFELTSVTDPHLCCGSAGTYSILERELSRRLLANKVDALQAGDPELIATANIGCLLHLRSEAKVPVVHWVQLIEEVTRDS